MSCLVPWEPPCDETHRNCDFTWMSSDVCDAYIINEDSFIDNNDESCTARATIPFANALYGKKLRCFSTILNIR